MVSPCFNGDFMTTLIFTATLNEIDNIESFVGDCLAQLPDAHMLVVDDNSPDGTGRKLDELKAGKFQGRLKVVHRPRKLGLGSAHKLAMKFALKEGYNQLITMDADYSHHPRYLPTMEKELKAAEFVTGSRYAEGGAVIMDWDGRSSAGPRISLRARFSASGCMRRRRATADFNEPFLRGFQSIRSRPKGTHFSLSRSFTRQGSRQNSASFRSISRIAAPGPARSPKKRSSAP